MHIEWIINTQDRESPTASKVEAFSPNGISVPINRKDLQLLVNSLIPDRVCTFDVHHKQSSQHCCRKRRQKAIITFSHKVLPAAYHGLRKAMEYTQECVFSIKSRTYLDG